MGGDAERCVALAVESDEVRTFVDEKLAYRDGAFYCGEHEERPAFVVGEVGVEALIECDAESRFVAALDQGLGCSIRVGHSYSANCCGFLPKSAPK